MKLSMPKAFFNVLIYFLNLCCRHLLSVLTGGSQTGWTQI